MITFKSEAGQILGDVNDKLVVQLNKSLD